MKVQFKRIHWYDGQVLPDWAQKFFDGATEEERKYFDVGMVHMLYPWVDGEVIEWATVEQVMQGINEYNSQFAPEGFNDNPAYVAYSLIKCVEAGLAEVRVAA